MPTASEVLDVMDRLEHDAERRIVLSRSYDIFRACVEDGIVREDSIDWIAQRMQQMLGEGLIAHGAINGGVRELPVWDGQWIQMMHDWRVTAAGRADAALYRSESRTLSTPHALDSIAAFDLFICHAGEDKGTVARPLSDAITQRGWTVWLDELALTVGDSLSRHIDGALAQSRFGAVVLSPSFFEKEWPQRELAGLVAREVDSRAKIILPVWHEVDHHYIAQRSPTLADRFAATTRGGIEAVAEQIAAAMRAGMNASAGPGATPNAQAAEDAWRGIIGGTTPVFIGAHVIDPGTGLRGQVEQVLGPQSALVRLEDGRLVNVRPS
jgi:TIR domain